jgi:predicted acetyltransferase
LATTLHYRFARAEDLPTAAQLVTHSFPGTQRPAAWHEAQLRDPIYGGGAETLFLGESEGRLIAALQLHPLRQWIGGDLYRVAGIGTVTISPTHRRRGLAAELMTHALRAAYARGDAASALYPFRTAFYAKLGYGVAGSVLQYQVPPQTLPDAPERARVELLDTDGVRAQALELYNRWAPLQTGQLERGDRLWAELCNAPDTALVGYRDEQGKLDGYALVHYRTDLPRGTRFLDVLEVVWLTNDARRGLYAWLASLGDQWEQLMLRALPSHDLGEWISEPRLPPNSAAPWRLWAPAATMLLGLMFRLVNIESAFARRQVNATDPVAMQLEITDGQIPENDGSWLLELSAGRARVRRGGTAPHALRMDIATLSRLFIGAISATRAYEAGVLTCDRGAVLRALDRALALPEPWTFDRF